MKRNQSTSAASRLLVRLGAICLLGAPVVALAQLKLPGTPPAAPQIAPQLSPQAAPQSVPQSAPQSAPAPAAARSASSKSRVEAVDSIAAVVNSEIITNREIDDRMAMVASRMKSQNITPPPPDALRKQLLERMIVDRAQLQLAKETGIRVDDAMLDRAVAGIADQNRMSLQEFRNMLERDGLSFARFREEIREEILLQRVREREVDSKVQVTESELDNFLASNEGADLTEMNIAQILVRIPENASPEQINQRRQRAEEALQQLRNGADFAKLAATYSDSSDALRGGEIGWRTSDRLPEIFVEALAKSRTGDVSAIKSANGFHILKLLGTRKAEDKAAAVPSVQQTRARHILIKVNTIVSAGDAKRKLQEVRERIVNKAATFEEMARLYSTDSTAAKGGDLGWLYPGDTVPEFERGMNALQPGELSEPVESPFGFHLIQVMERKKDDVSKERQRAAARQALRERKIAENSEEWLRQLRDRTYVEYRDEGESVTR
jgi:peptidyl-prolyl cis-trans isomerase SurA